MPQSDHLQRQVLPIPEQPYVGLTTYDYPTPGGKFSGDVNWVQIDVGKDAEDVDHLISPEERLRVAMAIQ